MSTDSGCEGTTPEGLLGYVNPSRSSWAARPLSRCYNTAAGAHFHWLYESCPSLPNVVHEGVLGFVK